MIAAPVKRFGIVGTALIVGLLAIALWLAGQNAWLKVTGWWDGRKLDRVTQQRDTARQDVRTGEASADVADRADTALDDRLGAHRGAATHTQVVIHDRILQGAGTAAGDDPDILRAVDAARGRAEAAAAAVQGTGDALPDPRATR